MPNRAITGNKKQLKDLYQIMKELGEMKPPGLCKNDFGSTWFGNLITRLGGDWEKVRCCGYWGSASLILKGNILSFTSESAWDELKETRKFIEERFPLLKVYYQCKESGMGIYTTNDKEGKFFKDKYLLWLENRKCEYYSSLPELIREVENITKKTNLKTFKDCKVSIEEWSEDRCYDIIEFEYVD